MIAVLSGDLKIIDFFDSKGANINQISINRETALILVIKRGWDILIFVKNYFNKNNLKTVWY